MGAEEYFREKYRNKRVLVTGHTGFKGSWLCEILLNLGAEVYGCALESQGENSLFSLLKLSNRMHSEIGDIRDYTHLREVISDVKPQYVFHLAAQPIVRESYRIPRETYETNVMGTVNLFEAIRELGIKDCSIVNVTTDKVYENPENEDYAFSENDKLNGFDPYSNSKSCSELVTASYKKSFFSEDSKICISTVRAGNVIGGGDFAVDRIIPDCVRSSVNGEVIHIRNPYSIRPYQHVLDPLFVYLLIAARQKDDIRLSGNYNVGPDVEDCVSTSVIADLFVKEWGKESKWENVGKGNFSPHEATFLKLDCTKLKETFNWNPVWNIAEAVKNTVSWYLRWSEGKDVREITDEQIESFLLKNRIFE